MRKRQSASVVAAVTSVVVFALCPPFKVRAQTVEWQWVPSNAVPQAATFASIQFSNLPPIPWNPYPQLGVYSPSDGSGWYWVDDRLVDYSALRQQRQIDRGLRSMESKYDLSSPDDLPPDLGGWEGPGEDYSPPPVNPATSYPTGSPWLSISQLTNGLTPLTIHGTVPDVRYEIFSRPTLTNSAWTSEGTVPGAANQDWTPTTVAVGYRTNILFFRA